MKFHLAITLACLLVSDANAVKLRLRGDPNAEKAELDATQAKLEEIKDDVASGKLTDAQGENVAK